MSLLIAALALCLEGAPAAPDQNLLFHASYDETLTANVAMGDPEPTILRTENDGAAPQFVEGVHGKAVQIDTRGLMYKAAGNFDSAEGSVQFWFQPVDWDGSDALMHHLFGTQMKPKCHMLIYRYMRTDKPIGGIFGKFAFYIRGGDPEDEKHSLTIPTTAVSDDWKRGEWHHVVATWAKREARLYVDGVLAGQAHGKLPCQQPDHFTVSANGGKGGVANAIDELRIYDRVLELPEILAHYVQGRRKLVLRNVTTPLPAPGELGETLKVGTLFQEGLTKLLVRVDATELPVRELAKLRVSLRLGAAGHEDAASSSLPSLNGLSFSDLAAIQTTIPIGGLTPGEYTLTVEVVDARTGKQVVVQRKQIDRPDAPWLGNDIGKSDQPVAPFEPVRVADGRIDVWGKQYELGDGFLLKQATVRPDPTAALHKSVRAFWHDASLLAAPLRLVATVNGKQVQIDRAVAKLLAAKPTHADFETAAQHGALRAKSTLRFDDDSIVTADIELAFADRVDVEDLRLEIPLKTQYCKWMNWTSMDGHRDASGAGAIPEGEGVVWHGVFHPLLWLGDDYRGFGYFCDNSLGWEGELTDPDRVLIRRDDEVTTVVLRLAAKAARTAGETWRTKISFLATPARPLPEKWRGMLLGGNFQIRHVPYQQGCPMHVVYWWTNSFFEDKQSHFSSPRTDTIRLGAIKDALAQSSDAPISHVFYTYPNSYHHPVVPDFYSDWCNKSSDDLLTALARGDAPESTRVDWNTSVRDWWLHQMNQLADLGVDGIYCDDPYTHPSFNERTGTAFVSTDGNVRPNYGLYGLREYFRRLRQMLNEKANHPHLFLHMSNQLTLPFQVYFDSFANGEHLNQRLKQHYIGKLSTDEIRAQYLGYQWGNIPFILPELGGEFRKSVEATEEMLALLLPHDVLIWNAWSDAATVRAYCGVLQNEFATWAEDCTFLPYWEARGIIDGQDEDLVVSAYVRDESVLLIVSNWSDEERVAKLTLNWDVLTDGKPMATATVAPKDGACALNGRQLSVPVPARNLHLVTLRG